MLSQQETVNEREDLPLYNDRFKLINLNHFRKVLRDNCIIIGPEIFPLRQKIFDLKEIEPKFNPHENYIRLFSTIDNALTKRIANIIWDTEPEFKFADMSDEDSLKGYTYQYIVKLLHNIDHLALFLIFDSTNNYYEEKLSKYIPNIYADVTPDLFRIIDDKLFIADVTRAADINSAHEVKNQKYNSFQLPTINIYYATIKVNSYNFLPKFYKDSIIEVRKILITYQAELMKNINSIEFFNTGKQMFNETSGASYVPKYPTPNELIRTIKRKLGMSDTDSLMDIHIDSKKIDTDVINYIVKNIDKLQKEFSYPTNKISAKPLDEVITKMSEVGTNEIVKERALIRVPPTNFKTLEIISSPNIYFTNENSKTYLQNRTGEILSSISSFQWSFKKDKWHNLFHQIFSNNNIQNELTQESIKVRTELETIQRQALVNRHRTNTDMLLVLIILYEHAKTVYDSVMQDDIECLRYAKKWKLTLKYTGDDFYENVRKDIEKDFSYVRNRLFKTKWVLDNSEVYYEITSKYPDLKSNVSLITKEEIEKEAATREFIKEEEKKNRHRKIRYGDITVTTDLEMKDFKDKSFFQESFGVGRHSGYNKDKVFQSAEDHKLIRIVPCTEERYLKVDRFLKYLSSYRQNDHKLITDRFTTCFEEKLVQDDMDEYLDVSTNNLIYKVLHTIANTGTSISNNYAKVRKNDTIKLFLDSSGNILTLMTSGSQERKSLLHIVISDEDIPEEYYTYFGIVGHAKIPLTTNHVYFCKPYSIVDEQLMRMIDGETVIMPSCVEEFTRLKYSDKLENYKEKFVEQVLAFRSLLYCEGNQATARLCEKLRYIVPNTLSTWSNTKGFITEYITDKPRTDFAVYLLYRVRAWLNKLEKIEFGKLLGDKYGLNIPRLFIDDSRIRDTQDIATEMFFVYYSTRRTYTDFTAFKTHNETLLKYKQKKEQRDRTHPDMCFRNKTVEQEMDLVTTTYKDFYHMAPNVLCRAVEHSLTTIMNNNKDLLVRTKPKIYNQTILSKTNTKACELPEPKMSKDYRKLLLEHYETKNMVEFHKVFLELSKEFTFYGTSKFEDIAISEVLKHDVFTFGDMMQKYHGKTFFFGIRNKDEEKGKMREFGCPSMIPRCYLKPTEAIADWLCSLTQEELITKGGRKPQVVEDTLNAILNIAKENGFKNGFRNIDYTKWSVNMFLQVFMYMVLVMWKLRLIDEEEAYWLLYTFNMLDEKKIIINKAILESKSRDEIIKKVIEACEDKELAFKVSGNWIQGKLNKFSSLLHYCKGEYTRYIANQIVGENIIVKFLCHSDDGITAIAYNPKYVDNRFKKLMHDYGDDWLFKLYSILEQVIALCLNMQESTKKSTESKFIAEFISIVYYRRSIAIPHYKGDGTLMARLPLDSYDKVNYAFITSILDAMTKGCPLITLRVMVRFIRRILQKIYNMGYDDLKRTCDLPIQLGGYINKDILPIALNGPDAHLLQCDRFAVSYLLAKSKTTESTDELSKLYFPTYSDYNPSKKWKRVRKGIHKTIDDKLDKNKIISDIKDFKINLFYLKDVNLDDPRMELIQHIVKLDTVNMKRSYDRTNPASRIIEIKRLLFGVNHIDSSKEGNPMTSIVGYFNNCYNEIESLKKESVYNSAVKKQYDDISLLENITYPSVSYLLEWMSKSICYEQTTLDKPRKYQQSSFKKGVNLTSIKTPSLLTYMYLINPDKTKVPKQYTRDIGISALKMNTIISFFELDVSNYHYISTIFSPMKERLLVYEPKWDEKCENRFENYYVNSSIPYRRLVINKADVLQLDTIVPIKMQNKLYKFTDAHFGTIINTYIHCIKDGQTKLQIVNLMKKSYFMIDDKKVTFEEILKSFEHWSLAFSNLNYLSNEIMIILANLYDIPIDPHKTLTDRQQQYRRYIDLDGFLHIAYNVGGDDAEITYDVTKLEGENRLYPRVLPFNDCNIVITASSPQRFISMFCNIINKFFKKQVINNKTVRTDYAAEGITHMPSGYAYVNNSNVFSNVKLILINKFKIAPHIVLPTSISVNGITRFNMSPKQTFIFTDVHIIDTRIEYFIKHRTSYLLLASNLDSLKRTSRSSLLDFLWTNRRLIIEKLMPQEHITMESINRKFQNFVSMTLKQNFRIAGEQKTQEEEFLENYVRSQLGSELEDYSSYVDDLLKGIGIEDEEEEDDVHIDIVKYQERGHEISFICSRNIDLIFTEYELKKQGIIKDEDIDEQQNVNIEEDSKYKISKKKRNKKQYKLKRQILKLEPTINPKVDIEKIRKACIKYIEKKDANMYMLQEKINLIKKAKIGTFGNIISCVFDLDSVISLEDRVSQSIDQFILLAKLNYVRPIIDIQVNKKLYSDLDVEVHRKIDFMATLIFWKMDANNIEKHYKRNSESVNVFLEDFGLPTIKTTQELPLLGSFY